MGEVGTWWHFVGDTLTYLILFGFVPIAYLSGLARGRRWVDPAKAALHALRKEQASKTLIYGECGVALRAWACQRSASHDGYHAYSKGGVVATWSSDERTTPKFVEEL